MHRATTIGAGLILTAVFACGPAEEPPAAEPEAPAAEAAGTVERLDPRLDELLAADAVVEQVADGFQFIEGPVWVGGADDGHLLFSDIPADTVYRWSEADGTSVFLNPVFLPELETNGAGRLERADAGPRGPSRAVRAWQPPPRTDRGGRLEGHDRGSLRGQPPQQPERRRLSLERRGVLHRSTLWPRQPGGGGARVERRLPPRSRRDRAPAGGRADPAQRHRALA